LPGGSIWSYKVMLHFFSWIKLESFIQCIHNFLIFYPVKFTLAIKWLLFIYFIELWVLQLVSLQVRVGWVRGRPNKEVANICVSSKFIHLFICHSWNACCALSAGYGRINETSPAVEALSVPRATALYTQ
jgi:hypothetical protein